MIFTVICIKLPTKQSINIPVIANGDISDLANLQNTMELSGCDAFMIARAGSGRPGSIRNCSSNEVSSRIHRKQ